MSDRNDEELDPRLLDSLLALPTYKEQSAFLQFKELLHFEGLRLLLDEAAYLVGNDPAKARQLAELCEQLAQEISAAAIIPRATYIRAQTYAINAEYKPALELITSAREGYEVLGQQLLALRTNLGLIHVLQELGRYQEALDAGKIILKNLQDANDPETAKTAPDRVEIAAKAYQNTGRCYEQMGRYNEALKAYTSAETLLLALNMNDQIGGISNNRGIVYLSLGQGREALEAFKQAARIFAENDETVYQAQAQINIGDACLMVGSYTQGLEAFEAARHLLAPLDALADKQVLLLDMADAYLALNLYAEAFTAFREADGLLLTTGMTHDRARALWGMGATLIAQLKYEEAGQVLAESEALFSGTQNIPMLCSVMLEQASLLAAQGQTEQAYARAQTALALVAETDWAVQQVNAHLRLADLALPNTAISLHHLLRAQSLLENLSLPHLRFRLNQRLGRLHFLSGNHAEAQRILESAMNEVEQSRSVLAHEMVRTSFIRDKTAIYDDLVQIHLVQESDAAVEQAFAVVEKAKSRTLLDLLTGLVNARASASSSNAELNAKLKTSQAELNSVYNTLMSSSSQTEAAARYAQALQVEQEINRLRLQISASPAEFSDPFGFSPNLQLLKEQFPADITLVEYYICGAEVLAFVRTNGKLKVVRNLTTVAEVQRQLQKLALQWDRFLGDRTFIAKHLPQLEQSTRRILSVLYNGLIASLSKLLPASSEDGVPHLIIVPHGALHQVPFHALFDGEKYLLDRYEISYAPSQTVWAHCQQRISHHEGKALIMGVADALIPNAIIEAKAIASHVQNSTVYIDQDNTTLATFQTKAPAYQILHLACHGLFRADNPMFSALKLHDGWLMAADVLQMDLTGAMVTLSACESGRGQVVPGDEVLGLTRAFLGAGASTLVVSLWLVQDETTATLMETFYKKIQQGLRRSAALRAAQLAVKEAHPHPYYWAPFVLVGQS